MFKFLKDYRMYKKHCKHLNKIAEGDKSYLINMFADVDLLERVINSINKDERLKAKFKMPDGSQLELSIKTEKERKPINWDN